MSTALPAARQDTLRQPTSDANREVSLPTDLAAWVLQGSKSNASDASTSSVVSQPHSATASRSLDSSVGMPETPSVEEERPLTLQELFDPAPLVKPFPAPSLLAQTARHHATRDGTLQKIQDIQDAQRRQAVELEKSFQELRIEEEQARSSLEAELAQLKWERSALRQQLKESKRELQRERQEVETEREKRRKIEDDFADIEEMLRELRTGTKKFGKSLKMSNLTPARPDATSDHPIWMGDPGIPALCHLFHTKIEYHSHLTQEEDRWEHYQAEDEL